ncbi:MAG: methionine--tRNA ligase subunit beta [Candidatus Paceibacterota bacterium]|jgi:methionyl-tRNA synthetase
MISFEEFKKIELRVARIEEAEAIEGSDKLVRLQVSLGEEKRQIVAGIIKNYSPKELVGKEVVIVANLETKKLRGFESQGMLLAADGKENGPVILIPQKEVDSGAEVK